MKRNAATPKGLEKRLRDINLTKVQDPRQAKKVKHSLPVVLSALIAAMTTRARSLRRVEERTGQIAQKHGQWEGIGERIADNTFGKVLPRLQLADLQKGLHRMVKAEHRRGNLQPTRLLVGTVAIDGKHVATLRWHDLCRVLELDEQMAQPAAVKTLLKERFPHLQLCCPEEGAPYALVRVHTVTLISSEAAPCVHQRPIEGATNENGAMPDLVDELHGTYGRSNLIQMLTTDAGNTSLQVATKIVGYSWDYFSQFKSEHGDLYREATRALANKSDDAASASYTDTQNGKVATYHAWQYDLGATGWLQWTHARQIVRVQRVTEDPHTGEITVGNRYYICSQSPIQLPAETCLWVSRGHWRCENETHWTSDTQFLEDRRRHAWSRHPNGVLIVSVLRMIAQSIVAIARKLSRISYSEETPTWRQVAEHFFLVLCSSILETESFDNV